MLNDNLEKFANKAWSLEDIQYIVSNRLTKTYNEIARNIGKTPKAVSQKLIRIGCVDKKIFLSNNKKTYKTIGSRRRANNRYNDILARTKYGYRKKDRAYKNVRLLVSRKDFIEWFIPRDFEGASVDRIDKNGDYELKNMQVIPLAENIRKDKIKAHDGVCECYKCHKVKPLEDFVKDKRRFNGHTTICIECDKKRRKESYMRKQKQLKFDKSYLRMAYEWAKNSYAKRRQVGCLIVKDKMIISDGYNGSPSGFPNVCEGDDGKTLPWTLHSESNAITKLARSNNSSDGATLYVTCQPCFDCAKLIIQAGIKRVVYSEEYHSNDGLYLLRKAGVEVERIEL